HAPERQVARARDMAARHARPRLGLGAGEAPRAAGVEQLLGIAGDDGEDIALAAHRAGTRARGERAGLDRDRAFLERAPLGAPFGPATVENGDLLDAVHAADEPGTRRGLHRAIVVDHQPVAIADADF